MKNHNTYSLTGNLLVHTLLIAILVTLILILLKIPTAPPTVGEIKQTKGKDRKLIKNNIPVVHVDDGNIEASISTYDTINVKVTNEVDLIQPIQVELYK